MIDFMIWVLCHFAVNAGTTAGTAGSEEGAMNLIRYRDNGGMVPDQDGEYVQFTDVRALVEAAVQKADTRYSMDRPDGGAPTWAEQIGYLIDRLTGMLESGKLWSVFRRLLAQGSAIEADYSAGKYSSYEQYAARFDAAARERVEEFLHALSGKHES